MISLIKLGAAVAELFARKDNPHEVTAAQLGTYSKSELNATTLNSDLVPLGSIPLTRFGNLLWMPINFSGSFEGATRTETLWFNAMTVEDDGTLVLLMNATNGVRESVYFSTFDIANAEIVKHNPIATEYRPPFIKSTEWIGGLYQCMAKTAIWGKLYGNSSYDAFVVLTNGSLNPEGHVGAYLDNTGLSVTDSGTVVASGQYVYLLQPSSGVDIDVYRISIVDIKTKSVVAWQKVTGITTYGMNLNAPNYPSIHVADNLFGDNINDYPLFRKVGNPATFSPSRIQIYGDVNPTTGEIWFRWLACGQHPFNNTYYADAMGFVCVFDPVKLTATVPESLRGDTTLVGTTDGPGYVLSGPNAYSGEAVKIRSNSQPHDSAIIGQNGIGFAINYGNENAGTICPFTVPNFKNYWEFWDYSKYTTVNKTTRNLIRRYPGPFGDSSRLLHVLATDRIGCISYTNDGDNWNSRVASFPVTAISASMNYAFNTQRLGTINGFQPVSRSDLMSKFKGSHCEYHDLNGTSVSVGCGRLWENSLSAYTAVDKDLNYSGSVSVTQAQWDSLKQAVKAAAGESIWPSGVILNVYMELQIFNDTRIPCIGIVSLYNASARSLMTVAFSFNTSGRTGAIASLSFKRVLFTWNQTNSNGILNRGRETLAPTCVARNASEGFTVVSISAYYANNGIGSQPGLGLTVMHLDGADDYRSDWIKTASNNPWYFGFTHYGVIPGYGLGAHDMTANRALSGTGLVWRPIGKTKSAIEAWATGGTQYMVMSQQAPVGWFAYIGESIPVYMSGKFVVMPATTIDLTKVKANPASSRFYVYVVDNGTTFEYQTFSAPLEETLTRCYVGFIETDTLKISRQSMVKITRIGIYRLSATQMGSAIPVVGGSPLSSATLDWTKTG